MMIQQSFFISAAPKKYSVTFLSSINSILSACRSVPLTIIAAGVDYVPMQLYFGIFVIAQIFYNAYTLPQVKAVDSKTPKEVGQEFVDQIERTDN